MLDRLNRAIENEIYCMDFCLKQYEIDADFWYMKSAGQHFDRAMDLIFIRDGISHRQNKI